MAVETNNKFTLKKLEGSQINLTPICNVPQEALADKPPC